MENGQKCECGKVGYLSKGLALTAKIAINHRKKKRREPKPIRTAYQCDDSMMWHLSSMTWKDKSNQLRASQRRETAMNPDKEQLKRKKRPRRNG